MAEIAADALRPYLVRVHGLDGAVRGTGFFVTQDRVVTCAHVIGEDQVVQLFLAGDLAGEGLLGHVRARSELGTDGEAPWPFPDLAILEVPGGSYPCLPVLAARPSGLDDCFTHGFAPRQGEIAKGTSRRFGFEGPDGDGYFLLRQGQATSGLSGSPLVCPTRRAVVGVVAASRDIGSDLGGWASPIAALIAEGPSDDELIEQGRIVARDNPTSAIRSRELWWKVLPSTEDDDGLLRGWARFVRQSKSNPSDLLLADFGVVPHLFAERELAEAEDWCNTADAISILNFPALAGAGKTRFAIELCQRMEPSGWRVGFWQGVNDVASIHAPRLIVIDYAENVAVVDLREFLGRLLATATPLTPVRVLLLTRRRRARNIDPLDQVRTHCPATLRVVIDAARDSQAAPVSLTKVQRVELYKMAVSRFREAWSGARNEQIDVPDLSHSRYENVLDVLFESYDCVLAREVNAGDRNQRSRGESIDRVLDHEERYWGLTPVVGASLPQVRLSVALMTLTGADTRSEAKNLVALVYGIEKSSSRVRRATLNWLYDHYGSGSELNPLGPDRVGEALIVRAFIELPHGLAELVGGVFETLSNGQISHALVVLSRICSSSRAIRQIVAVAIAENLERIAIAIARVLGCARVAVLVYTQKSQPAVSLPHNSAAIVSLTRLITGPLREDLVLASFATGPSKRTLADYYSEFGGLAEAAGQYSEAVRLYTNARLVVNELSISAQTAGAAARYRRLSSALTLRLKELASNVIAIEAAS